MSTDAAVAQDLIQTLEDGKDGFAAGAERLEQAGETIRAQTFRDLGEKRTAMSEELQQLAATYGDDLDDSGSVAAKVHRGWMAAKAAMASTDPGGIIDVAMQGEDHAISEFDEALGKDISPEFKPVVERQLAEIRLARDRVQALRA